MMVFVLVFAMYVGSFVMVYFLLKVSCSASPQNCLVSFWIWFFSLVVVAFLVVMFWVVVLVVCVGQVVCSLVCCGQSSAPQTVHL